MVGIAYDADHGGRSVQGVRPIIASALGITLCLGNTALADPDLASVEAELQRLEGVVQAQQTQI